MDMQFLALRDRVIEKIAEAPARAMVTCPAAQTNATVDIPAEDENGISSLLDGIRQGGKVRLPIDEKFDSRTQALPPTVSTFLKNTVRLHTHPDSPLFRA
jgi:hypothetical protein